MRSAFVYPGGSWPVGSRRAQRADEAKLPDRIVFPRVPEKQLAKAKAVQKEGLEAKTTPLAEKIKKAKQSVPQAQNGQKQSLRQIKKRKSWRGKAPHEI